MPPFHIVPVDEVILRHDAHVRIPDGGTSHHYGAGGHGVAGDDIREGAVFQSVGIEGLGGAIVKVYGEAALLDVFRHLHMIYPASRHSHVGVGFHVFMEGMEGVLVYHGIIIQAHEMLVALVPHDAEPGVEAAGAA